MTRIFFKTKINFFFLLLIITRHKAGHHRDLFDEKTMICGKESAADNYARGFYTIGSQFIDIALERLRKLAENCSNLHGFIITHSFAGGTGSGFTSLIMNNILNDYGRVIPKVRIFCEVCDQYFFH